jgi:hypothetical protein
MSKNTSVKTQKLKKQKTTTPVENAVKKTNKSLPKSVGKAKDKIAEPQKKTVSKSAKASAKIKPRPPKSIKPPSEPVIVEQSQLTEKPRLDDVQVYKGKDLSHIFKDYFSQLDEYEKSLLAQFENIVLETEEDFVVKSQIFSSVLKEINETHKNKKDFIKSLLDYQIKTRQMTMGMSGPNGNQPPGGINPLSSVQNFMVFINNLQDQQSEKKINDVIIQSSGDTENMEEFLKQSEDFNPTKVFSDTSALEDDNKDGK